MGNSEYFKGRGSQSNPNNKFHQNKISVDDMEGLDEPFLENTSTEFIKESPKKIISVSKSPDISFLYSINPYQGCEHGCIVTPAMRMIIGVLVPVWILNGK